MQNNFQVMFGGFSLIFVYIAITLGRWNALEQRVKKNPHFFKINLTLFQLLTGCIVANGDGGDRHGPGGLLWLLLLLGPVFQRHASLPSLSTFGYWSR